jgi:alkyl hydroperoxide reductase subunit D
MEPALESLREALPEAAKDIKINLGNVLTPGTLGRDQVFGVALSAAYAGSNAKVVAALLAEARAAEVPQGTIEDAKAAAILMAMNNVLYRFKHVIGKDDYQARPARLRMQRLAQVTSNKADFELYCLAVSAINNCQTCMASHEASVLGHGLGPEQVFDAIRIAATVTAFSVAVGVSEVAQ